MEDLWRLKNMSYRVDLAGKAEYDLMLRRFREEEERKLRRDLLYEEKTKPAAPNDQRGGK